VRGDLIAQAFSALNGGDPTAFEALLDPRARWIGVADISGEVPT
jgi:hypothetical protein